MSALINRYLPKMLIVLFPLMLIWQGLDFTDTGFLLTNYQQIFNDSSSIETSFRLWLTNVIGGVWTYFFGETLGFIGYKIAGILFIYATVFTAYRMLRSNIKEKYLYWGFFLSVVFVNRLGYLLNYNGLTAFFYILSAYFIVKGLDENKYIMVLGSGFFMGLNFFVRLPNILGFIFVLSILFYGYIKGTAFKTQIRQAQFFIIGYLIAFCVSLIAMYFLGHLNAYIGTFKGVFDMLNDPAGHHSGNKLLDIFIGNHRAIVLKDALLLTLLAFSMALLKISSSFNKKFLQYIIIIALAGASVYLYFDYYEAWFSIIATMVGILYFFLLYCTFDVQAESKLRLLSFLAFLCLVLIPIGSNNGILNAGYGMYLGFPIALQYLASIDIVKVSLTKTIDNSNNDYIFILKKKEFNLIKSIGFGLLLFMLLNSTYHYTYRDSNHRFEMSYSVNHSKLKGVLTTKARAQVVQEMLEVLPEYVHKDDYLLAYEQTSLVYFLTNTRPYLYSSWPMLQNPDKIEKLLKRALAERPKLPVVVRAMESTETHGWPRSIKLRNVGYLKGNRQLLDNFIKNNNYQIVWENGFFEILLPRVDR